MTRKLHQILTEAPWDVAEPADGWDAHDARIAAAEAAEAAEAARERRIARRRALIHQGAPSLLLDLAGERARTEAIVQLAHALSRGVRLVVLAGTVGLGKTAAAVLWLLSCEARVYFRTAPALARESRYHATDSHWSRYTRAVLDDLGAEYSDRHGSFATDIDELIAHYHGGVGKRLVITTNLSMIAFHERYGARVTDRINEAGQWITLTGPSMRGTK